MIRTVVLCVLLASCWARPGELPEQQLQELPLEQESADLDTEATSIYKSLAIGGGHYYGNLALGGGLYANPHSYYAQPAYPTYYGAGAPYAVPRPVFGFQKHVILG